MLKAVFSELVFKYSNTHKNKLWQEIEEAYTDKKRYYHNLTHLANMYDELLLCQEKITDWDTILFALFYHDIIYKPIKNDNEEKSAELAVKRLTEIGFPKHRIELCYTHILATKSHIINTNTDTNLFTDADLSILGYPWSKYEAYRKAVRREYAYYPDLLYNPGRKKVLVHFLEMQYLYKTSFFKAKYEAAAHENIHREITML